MGSIGGTKPRQDCNIIMDPTMFLLRGCELDLFVSRCGRMRVITYKLLKLRVVSKAGNFLAAEGLLWSQEGLSAASS